jgi:hypothetical protein
VNGKNEVVVQPVKFDPSHPIEFLKEPPKEYRSEAMRPLAQAEVPHMEAHPFTNPLGTKGTELSRAAVPIRFDPKSQAFTVAKTEMHGGRSTTVFAPMNNHSGSLQARGGSFSGGSGFRGGGSSGSSGFRGGGGSSGGGSHSSGGTSSASSGSHSGGGGSTASSSSSGGSSSGGGGASAGGGGSHH